MVPAPALRDGARIVIDRKPPARAASVVRDLLGRVARAGRAELARQRTAVDPQDLASILAAVGASDPRARAWSALERHGGDPAIVVVGRAGGGPTAFVRVARSQAARDGLVRAARALEALRGGLADAPNIDRLVPRLLGHGEVGGGSWLAEAALPGQSGRSLVGDETAERRFLATTAEAIGAIHAATAHEVTVGEDEIRRWIEDRAATIARTTGDHEAVARIRLATATGLRGRTLSTSWIHGDLWPANVLVAADCRTITGLIDWDSAEPDELGLHDRLHLALTTRRLVERKDLGTVLAERLRGVPWTEVERIALGVSLGSELAKAFDGLAPATALWLYWLRFVSTNVARHPRLATDRGWVAANIEQVLAWA